MKVLNLIEKVNENGRRCKANLEMSYSYQNRNVPFSRLRSNGSPSLMNMFSKLEASPRMVHWRSERFSHPHRRRRSFLWNGLLANFPVSQDSVLIGDAEGTIESILNNHLGTGDMVLNLVEPTIVRHGKVIPQRSFRLGT